MSFLDSAASALLGDSGAPYALIYQAQRSIGTLVADVTVREAHTDEDTITVHPVETGTPISDHVFANPQVLEVTCGFSDSSAGTAGYVQEVYQAFLALKATRTPFDVSTGKRMYQNMLFASITVITDESSEFALMVTARLQQVIITETSGSGMSADNQADPASTAPEADAGSQVLQPVAGGIGSDSVAAPTINTTSGAGDTSTSPVG